MSTPLSDGDALKRFKDVVKSEGISLNSAVCGKSFILFGELRKWLYSRSDPSNDASKTWIRKLLEESFAQYPMLLYNKIDAVNKLMQRFQPGRKCCLKLFCLLALHNLGHLIQQVSDRSEDSSLPLPQDKLFKILRGRDHSDNYASQWAQQLETAQWRFYPRQFGEFSYRKYDAEDIIPITSTKKIKSGGIATVWQIQVPEEYVSPELKRNHRDVNIRQENEILFYRFAMKSFKEKDVFERERTNYDQVSNNPGMVKYIWGYEQDQARSLGKSQSEKFTYNLVLELCEGDLWRCITTQKEPRLPDDISGFWFGLFPLLSGLERLHRFQDSEGTTWNGWHTDVKPDNILKVGNQWKLGDPGFAKFKKAEEDTPTPKTKIEAGTATWGAPETRLKVERDMYVTQTIDIWSMGCVMSVVATWVVLGTSGVTEFQNIRQKAIDDIVRRNPGHRFLENGDHFHDSKKVLNVVTDWHNYVRMCIRHSDKITGQVLEVVDKVMLVETSFRATASVVRESLENIEQGYVRHCYDFELGKDFQDSIKATSGLTTGDGHEHPGSQPSQPVTKPKAKGKEKDVLYVAGKPTPDKNSDKHSAISDQLSPKPLVPHPESKPVMRRGHTVVLRPEDEDELRHTTIRQVREKYGLQKSKTSQVWRQLLTKVGMGKRPSPYEVFAAWIKNRDVKILVDNSGEMVDHWDNVIQLVQIIVLETAEFDDDGLDMSFAIGNKTLENESNPMKFVNLVKAERPKKGSLVRFPATMAQDIETIFTDYKLRVDRALHSTEKLPKNVTLLVLTNGAWARDFEQDVKRTILNIVGELKKRLRESELAKRPFSIQFVQFGDDPDATRVLTAFDDDLESECGHDIVDREKWDGTFSKIILGSFLEEFDQMDKETTSNILSSVAASGGQEIPMDTLAATMLQQQGESSKSQQVRLTRRFSVT